MGVQGLRKDLCVRVRMCCSLWVTMTQRERDGRRKTNLYFLVDLYGVNEATSEKALALMKAKLDEVAEVIRKRKES